MRWRSRKLIRTVNETLTYIERWLLISAITAVTSSAAIGLFYMLLKGVVWVSALILGVETSLASAPDDYSAIAMVTERPLMVLLTVVVFSLASSLLVYKLAPEAAGAGTDYVVHVYHHLAGKAKALVALVKAVSSALLLGGGGSAGPEGPSVQIGGALGSFVAGKLKLTVEERKIAMISGVASALSFIFQSPVGAALFAVEVLYISDFETEALIPALFSSVIAYSLSLHILGPEQKLPSIAVPSLSRLYSFSALLSYVAAGLVMAVPAMVYIYVFSSSKKAFASLGAKIPTFLVPPIGAVIAALIGVQFPQILGTGERSLALLIRSFEGAQEAYGPRLAGSALIGVVVLGLLKIVATSLTVGSGGSGGLLAPGLFAGAMIGYGVGFVLQKWTGLPAVVYAYIGMSALFGAASKTSIALSFMVAEIAGSPTLLVPNLIATLTASMASRSITIVESQLPHRVAPQVFTAEALLERVRRVSGCIEVQEYVDTGVLIVRPWEELREAVARMLPSRQLVAVVIDDSGKVIGVLDPGRIGLDVFHALRSRDPVAEFITPAPTIAHPFCLDEVLELMVYNNINYVVVVNKDGSFRGIVRLEDLSAKLAPDLTMLQRKSSSQRG